DKFSRYLDGNIVSRVNSAAGTPVEVDEETAHLLDFGQTLYRLSDRRFDLTSGVLRRVWRFDGSDRVPSASDVQALLQLVGWYQVLWDSPLLQMPAGMEIDLGGIGKEYAVDRCAAMLREMGAGPCLVNFGGDLVATEAPARRRRWKIGIEGLDQQQPQQVIDLKCGALATSGDARRFLLKDGVRYSHILDPLTGWPVSDAPRSITIVADTCVQAGMLSTLGMLKGSGAEAFLDEQAVQSWCRR
ncbi:MAG: FAD:protein FMN transferase, partial [Woeseiaceae bacterium]